MHLRLLLICLISLYFNHIQAQFQEDFDTETYIVRWSEGVGSLVKDNFERNFRSTILCQMTFADREYAWIKFRGDYSNSQSQFQSISDVLDSINVNGGAIGASDPPIIDGTSYDFYSSHSNTSVDPNSSCMADFDLTTIFGTHPVSLYNLDTGVKKRIVDNSTADLDFSGPITCDTYLFDCDGQVIFQADQCTDTNGHGSHGLGIQQNIINKSEEIGGSSVIDLYSYKVFEENGVGNLGAILCALSDIITDTILIDITTLDTLRRRRVVNCSFSFKGDDTTANVNGIDPLYEAFRAMANERIFSVVAAGNDGQEINDDNLIYPLSYFSDVQIEDSNYEVSTISVGAVSCDQLPAENTNYSPTEVDVSILGTLPGPSLLPTGIEYYQGTSQATFVISTIAAILYSHQNVPDLEQLKCSLISSADVFEEFSDYNVGSGIFRASKALEYLQNTCVLSDNCPPINYVSGIITDNGVRESSGIVISNAQVKNNDFIFRAEKCINLEAGFLADPAIEFSAIIEDCKSEN